MKTTIEEILNSALVGKTITIYVNATESIAGRYNFLTPDKRDFTIETHKRVIDSADIWCYNDDYEIHLSVTERILGSMLVCFPLYSQFEIEDTPIPIDGAKDINKTWTSVGEDD